MEGDQNYEAGIVAESPSERLSVCLKRGSPEQDLERAVGRTRGTAGITAEEADHGGGTPWSVQVVPSTTLRREKPDGQ
jgi:hypothetical protein